MSTLLTTTKNFYIYQKERFPIVVLGLSFLPAILSSGAVVASQAEFKFVLIALIISVVYLLHVRIIDEFRDYEHDLRHHKERPVSSGIISLKELRVIDWLAIVAVPLASLYSGTGALLIAVAMLLYSYFARKEFFLGLQFRRYFYLYNAVNLVQMLLLQILVYTIANPSFSFTTLVTVHFLFTTTGTIIFEFLRKVKSPGNDGTGKDTYTWFLGLNNALLIYAAFATFNILLFVKTMFLIQTEITYWIPIAIALVVGTYSTLFINKMRKEKKANQLMQLSFMVMYGSFNILLFLAA
ncbi:UbiA family prenyltransferase [bacterium]|nr:UbiA family prenyltransferase [bacterium]